MALQITSSAFAEGEPIPTKHSCDGEVRIHTLHGWRCKRPQRSGVRRALSDSRVQPTDLSRDGDRDSEGGEGDHC